MFSSAVTSSALTRRRRTAAAAFAALLLVGAGAANAMAADGPKSVVLENTSSLIKYSGFAAVDGSEYTKDSEHQSQGTGSNAVFVVDGTKLAIYATKGPDRGQWGAYAGPAPLAFGDLYSPTYEYNALILETTVQDKTKITYRTGGGRNGSSAGSVISLDRVVFSDAYAEAPAEQPKPTTTVPTPTTAAPAPVPEAPVVTTPATQVPVTTPTTSAPAPVTPAPAAPVSGTSVSVTAYGAVGDGHTDDTAALQKALDSTISGGTLTIPANKTFVQSKTLKVNNSNIRITGAGTLLATNDGDSSFWIKGDNVTVDGGLTFRNNSKTRGGAWEHYRVVLWSKGTVLKNITVDGSHAAGIFMQGATDFLIDTVEVKNTMADGIHNTGGAHDGVIRNATVRNVGDDGIAVVSYKQDGPVVKNITIENVKIYKPSAPGRSLSVVGGENITFKNFYVENSSAASIYVSAEKEWNTDSVNNVKFIGGTIKDANWYATNDHGAILIYNSQAGGIISNVLFQDVKIENTRANAGWNMAILDWGKGTSNVKFVDMAITGTPNAFKLDGNPSATYSFTNVTRNGLPVMK